MGAAWERIQADAAIAELWRRRVEEGLFDRRFERSNMCAAWELWVGDGMHVNRLTQNIISD